MFGLFSRNKTVQLGRVSASEAADCARLHGPAFAHGWSASEFETLLTDSACIADGAFQRGQLRGFCLSRRAADEAEILSIVVAPAIRRGGIGRRLLTQHMARAAASGVATLFLEVESGNVAAIGLYRGLGFDQVGIRRAYTRMKDGSSADALVMRRKL